MAKTIMCRIPGVQGEALTPGELVERLGVPHVLLDGTLHELDRDRIHPSRDFVGIDFIYSGVLEVDARRKRRRGG
jgi:hypothetical protein